MAKEIEHKFLVNKKLLPKFKKLKSGDMVGDLVYLGGNDMVQGYLSRSPVVRIRLMSNNAKGILTIKGKGCRVRDEFEYPISRKDAEKMMKLCGKRKIKKVRHYLGPWEIDFFKGPHKGLILAEIELPNKKAKLPPLPEWIEKEVTYDPQYSNASLSEPDHPFLS